MIAVDKNFVRPRDRPVGCDGRAAKFCEYVDSSLTDVFNCEPARKFQIVASLLLFEFHCEVAILREGESKPCIIG